MDTLEPPPPWKLHSWGGVKKQAGWGEKFQKAGGKKKKKKKKERASA